MTTTRGSRPREATRMVRLTTAVVIAWTSLALIVISHHPQFIEELSWLWQYTGIFGLIAAVGLSEVQRRRELADQARIEACVRDALTDPLTGLDNRRVLERELEQALQDTDDRCWLVLIDIDNFKDVNDTYGHQAGDEVLRAVSRTLRTCIRRTDVLARFGGEEFAILVRHPSFADVLQHANQIRQQVAATRCNHDDLVLRVTCSIGFAQAHRPVTAVELIEQADQALYLAKGAGRNRCAWHDGTSAALVYTAARLPQHPEVRSCDSAPPPQPVSWNRNYEPGRLRWDAGQYLECASPAGAS